MDRRTLLSLAALPWAAPRMALAQRAAAPRAQPDRPQPDRPQPDRPQSDRPQSDRPQSDRPLTERDRADIARAEAWLGGLRTLKARFLQIAQNGAAAEGTAWIQRPGRMRFEYDPPEPLLLVASYGQFFYFDRQLKQATTLPLSATPLGMLLRDEVKLSGDVTVSQVERGGGLLRITLFRTGQAAEGRLTLVFAETPMELKQWAVVDAQGQETRVSLFQSEFGGRFPALLFDFNDPRFREELGIPG